MSKLLGMWLTKFDDAGDGSGSAQDGQVIEEIGTDYILVTIRNVVAGAPSSSSQLFKISDLANDNTTFFENEEALNAWHAFIAGTATVVPFDKGGR
jgi:hypothetical protein